MRRVWKLRGDGGDTRYGGGARGEDSGEAMGGEAAANEGVEEDIGSWGWENK